MEMTFRWYGNDNDSVSLDDIRQIPGTQGVVWALHHLPAGEAWSMGQIRKEKEYIESFGLNVDVVESVNVHEDIKLGLPTRDQYIENYKQTIKNLAQAGVKVICYNFMPVFDWIRTDLNKQMKDGSTALFYGKEEIENATPSDIVNRILDNPNYTLPGWEPERLSQIQGAIKQYEGVDAEQLWGNLQYFLEQIIPVCEQYDVNMAIHPDDPPWSVFGLPRIISSYNDLNRLVQLVDSPNNGITLCSGALGVRPDNNIPKMIYDFKDRIHFAHIRNVKRFDNGDFIESSHREEDGSVDVVSIVKAYHDIGYKGYVRPDHGRHIWSERCRPGYGLYDRALGIMYMLGIWDMLDKGVKD